MAQQQQGTGFTNIQSILNANQGNQLGAAVGNGVQNATNQATQGLNTAQQNFQNQTQQGLQTLQSDQANEQQVLQDPTKASDQDVANFAQYRGGQYSGPTNLGDISSIQNQAQNAQDMGQAAGTTAGRLGLLQQFASGGKQYTSGQQNLDNLLLGSSANDNLNSARRVSTGLVNNVNQANQNAQSQAQTVQGQYQNFGNQTNSDIQAQQNPILGNLTQTANTSQAQKDATAARLQAGLTSGTLSASDAQLLGLTNGQTIDNVDLNSLLTVDPTKANQQNVANAQQAAQLNALARLSGQGAFNTDPSQLGAFGKNQFTFDTSGLGTDVANAQQNYNTNVTTPLAAEQQAQNYLTNGAAYGQGAQIGPALIKKYGSLAGVEAAYAQNPNVVSDYMNSLSKTQKMIDTSADQQAIVNYLNQYNQNSAAVQALQKQYGIGNTLNVTPDQSSS